MSNTRFNNMYGTTNYNHWILPAAPRDLSTNLEGVKLNKVDPDDLNVLTPKFVDMMLDAMAGSTSKADTFKKILERIHESYKKGTDEDAAINRKRQKFVVTTGRGDSVTVFDVDTTKSDYAAVIYGFSTKPGHLEYHVFNDDPAIAFDLQNKAIYNNRDYHVLINHVDTYIVGYDDITGIFYPSCPESVHNEYMNTTQRETEDQQAIERRFTKIRDDLTSILNRNNIVEFIVRFSNYWVNELRDVDIRYYIGAFNIRQEIWKTYYEIVNKFLSGSEKEYQLKFFTEGTIAKLKESISTLYGN